VGSLLSGVLRIRHAKVRLVARAHKRLSGAPLRLLEGERKKAQPILRSSSLEYPDFASLHPGYRLQAEHHRNSER